MNTDTPAIPPAPADAPLASRLDRFLAQLIDVVIVVVASMVLFAILPANNLIVKSIVSAALLIGINWTFLPLGQTIGKKIMNLRIVRRSGEVMPVNDLLMKRMLPVLGANIVPFIGTIAVIVDALLIFREKQNTFHDDLADTKVIKLPTVSAPVSMG